jgi:uncharacterized membrane protein YGL010W
LQKGALLADVLFLGRYTFEEFVDALVDALTEESVELEVVYWTIQVSAKKALVPDSYQILK